MAYSIDYQTMEQCTAHCLFSTEHDENYKQIMDSVRAWDNKNNTEPRKALQSTINMERMLMCNMYV